MAHASPSPTAPPLPAPAASPGPSPAGAAAPVERASLAGGVRVVVERRPGAPRVAIEVVWPGGLAAEPADRAGGTAVLAAAITDACQPLADADGGALTSRAGRGQLAVRGTWPAVAWREGLRTARGCPASARVGDALVAARDHVARDVALARTSPAQRAVALAARARWGSHALGLDPHRDGGVAALAPGSLRAHLAAQLAAPPIVVVVGDVALADVTAALTATEPAAPPPPPAASTRPRAAAVARPANATPRQLFVEQAGPGAAVAITLPGLPATAPDRPALELLAAILAGADGPLAEARAGAAISVALPDADDAGALVLVLAGPAPITPRVAALRDALARLAADGPDPVAVELARARLLAEQDRAEVRAATLARAALTGAADPRAALADVDPAAVAGVAAASLRWDQAVLVTVQPPHHTPAVDRLGRRPGRAAHPARRAARPRPRGHR